MTYDLPGLFYGVAGSDSGSVSSVSGGAVSDDQEEIVEI